jgi:4a-hydroxytetrahydrobiopterin dehydratase
MAETVLSSEEIDARLRDQPGWAVVEGALHREMEFADFREAFGFMAMVALAAERLDHHPDWSNSWNKVVIDVVNHAADGITDRCFTLATEIDRALGE